MSRWDKSDLRQRSRNCALHTEELFEPRSPLGIRNNTLNSIHCVIHGRRADFSLRQSSPTD